jgi:hypothetical protein
MLAIPSARSSAALLNATRPLEMYRACCITTVRTFAAICRDVISAATGPSMNRAAPTHCRKSPKQRCFPEGHGEDASRTRSV